MKKKMSKYEAKVRLSELEALQLERELTRSEFQEISKIATILYKKTVINKETGEKEELFPSAFLKPQLNPLYGTRAVNAYSGC
ncbi:hypothetical protein FWH09_00850 [Candidatus Saccharibacteria bacterium]|nr:hypothetical protein [Candidatus Saccharibacteria bacterium]